MTTLTPNPLFIMTVVPATGMLGTSMNRETAYSTPRFSAVSPTVGKNWQATRSAPEAVSYHAIRSDPSCATSRRTSKPFPDHVSSLCMSVSSVIFVLDYWASGRWVGVQVPHPTPRPIFFGPCSESPEMYSARLDCSFLYPSDVCAHPERRPRTPVTTVGCV